MEIIQQERVQHCSVEQGVRVPRRWVREAVSHVPESVPQRRVQQRTVGGEDEQADPGQAKWQDWRQWQQNGWQWW